MKLRHLVVGVMPFLALALASQAQTNATLDWKFSVAGNPSAPTTAVLPFDAAATATFVSGNNSYFFGTGPEGLYGTPTGLWSMEKAGAVDALLELNLELLPATNVDLTLVLTQFIDSSQTFFPGTVAFSLPNAVYDGRVTVVPQTGNMLGLWVADTYHWDDVSFLDTINLGISPGAGSGSLFLDEVFFNISGPLTVPEPMYAQLAAAGLLVFGIRAWFRRGRKA